MQKISSSLIGLLALLLLLASCEREPVHLTAPQMPASNVTPSPHSNRSALADAHAALSAQDYASCATRFAAAARLSSGEESATCWYRASQCAARTGDYKTSRFHMRTAASKGFASLHELRADPLLRPLRSDSHWNLIDDLVKENYLASNTQKSAVALCRAPENLDRPLRLGTL